MSYTLVDAPVGPHSEPAALRAWLAECERRVAADPEDEGWRLALEEAKAWLERAERAQ